MLSDGSIEGHFEMDLLGKLRGFKKLVSMLNIPIRPNFSWETKLYLTLNGKAFNSKDYKNESNVKMQFTVTWNIGSNTLDVKMGGFDADLLPEKTTSKDEYSITVGLKFNVVIDFMFARL